MPVGLGLTFRKMKSCLNRATHDTQPRDQRPHVRKVPGPLRVVCQLSLKKPLKAGSKNRILVAREQLLAYFPF